MAVFVAWIVWLTAWLGPVAGLLGAVGRALQVLEADSRVHLAELRRLYGEPLVNKSDAAKEAAPAPEPAVENPADA